MTDFSTSEKFKEMMSLRKRVLLEGNPMAIVYDTNGSYAYLGNRKINFSKNAHNILIENGGRFHCKDYRIGKFYLSDKDKWIDIIVPSHIASSFGVSSNEEENELYYIGAIGNISKNLWNCLTYALGWKSIAQLILKFKRVKIVNIGFPPEILYKYLSIFFSANDLSYKNIDEIITINPDHKTENIATKHFPNVKCRFYKGYIENVSHKEIFTEENETGIAPLVIYFVKSNFSSECEEDKNEAARHLGEVLRNNRRLYEILFTFDIENLNNSPLELCHDEFESLAMCPKRYKKRLCGYNKSIINRLVRMDQIVDLHGLDSKSIEERLSYLHSQEGVWSYRLEEHSIVRQLHYLVHAINMGIREAEYHLFHLLVKYPYLIWNQNELFDLITSIANQGIHPIFNKLAGIQYYKESNHIKAIEYLSKYILTIKSDKEAYEHLLDAKNKYQKELQKDLEECYKREEAWQKEMDDDWRRESFYALTDGEYGDYPDDFDDDYSFMGM